MTTLDETTAAGSPAPKDWISSWMEYTEGQPTPRLFRLWSAIGAVAATLERRVYITTAHSPIYPNLFILLVATPGVGKSIAIDPIAQLWRDTKKLHVAPDSVSKASLVDAIAKADRKILIPPTSMLEYHSLACCASELGVLMPSHDLDFMSLLNAMYDNRSNFREEKRTLDRSIDISRPQINMLAGSQPGFMASMFPEEAWAMGTTSRIIMVYSSDIPKIDLFDQAPKSKKFYGALVTQLTKLTELIGEAKCTDAAKEKINDWYRTGCQPVPDHSKLEHYNTRRILYLLKLVMISAASRTGGLLIDAIDVDRALRWILNAEKTMPDIFRRMVGKSDNQTIQELHFFMYREYSKNKKPLHESVLYHFLAQHVPSDKIGKIVETAIRANIVQKLEGTSLYIPRPRSSHGIE